MDPLVIRVSARWQARGLMAMSAGPMLFGANSGSEVRPLWSGPRGVGVGSLHA